MPRASRRSEPHRGAARSHEAAPLDVDDDDDDEQEDDEYDIPLVPQQPQGKVGKLS